MIRSLFFIFKVGFIVVLAFLATTYSGMVTIEWESYTLKTSTTALAALIALVALAVYFLSNLYWRIRRFPLSFARLFRVRTLDNMEYSMRMALESCKSGSTKHLRKDLARLADLLEDPILRAYFEGKVEKLNKSPEAVKIFQELSTANNGKFIGNCELAQMALQEKDYSKALFHAELAFSVYKKSPWVLETLLRLYLKEENYIQAETIMRQLEKAKVLSLDKLYSLQAGIFYKQASNERDIKTQISFLEKALGYDFSHLPSALLLAKILAPSGKFKNAQRIIEDVWKESPHADLIPYYLASTADELGKAKLIEHLLSFNPDHPTALEGAAEVYLKAKLWGKARATLKKIPDAHITVNTCRIWADLEASEYDDIKKAQAWYLRMGTALPSPQWTCSDCHQSFSKAEPVCKNCLGLNTVQWQ